MFVVHVGIICFIKKKKKQVKDVNKKKLFKKICKRFQSLFTPRLDCPQIIASLYVYPFFTHVFSYIIPIELAYVQVV